MMHWLSKTSNGIRAAQGRVFELRTRQKSPAKEQSYPKVLWVNPTAAVPGSMGKAC